MSYYAKFASKTQADKVASDMNKELAKKGSKVRYRVYYIVAKK